LSSRYTGYYNIKNYIDPLLGPGVYNSVDFPVARLGEILLIYAEARAELGELTQADLDITINLLRDRAEGMPHLNLNPPTDPWLAAQYPLVSDPNILEIRRERRVEMALEGYRHDDLMRYGAGKLMEEEPLGVYFPALGAYDFTGDGVPDLRIIGENETKPKGDDREQNSLGVYFKYYIVGPEGSGTDVWLTEGDSGYMISDTERGTFVEPKYYYRPIPQRHVIVNPNLTQIFGWN
jgi:hypothetical protein